MEALRLIADTTNHQVTIVLPADNELPSTPTGEHRKPSQLLRGTVELRDDQISAPIPADDWDALK